MIVLEIHFIMQFTLPSPVGLILGLILLDGLGIAIVVQEEDFVQVWFSLPSDLEEAQQRLLA